uniref:ATP synthase complex subunit 8 n=1 Tax=Glaphyrus comosus TaxID=1227469 RepID=S4SW85_9SCAR|nr:ATP synthase F0 subunit 8 [Glaphyrus comosus]
MPQMAPLNWLILFILFSLIYLIFNSMNYFMFNYQPQTNSIKLMESKINWKW